MAVGMAMGNDVEACKNLRRPKEGSSLLSVRPCLFITDGFLLQTGIFSEKTILRGREESNKAVFTGEN